ncbi:MAG: bifunctional riboflavin kinase/FAD synthetase, partial [Thermoplasmata archaeon]
RDIGEVTGKVQIEFVALIRENKKFESLDALREQIAIDINAAREVML